MSEKIIYLCKSKHNIIDRTSVKAYEGHAFNKDLDDNYLNAAEGFGYIITYTVIPFGSFKSMLVLLKNTSEAYLPVDIRDGKCNACEKKYIYSVPGEYAYLVRDKECRKSVLTLGTNLLKIQTCICGVRFKERMIDLIFTV